MLGEVYVNVLLHGVVQAGTEARCSEWQGDGEHLNKMRQSAHIIWSIMAKYVHDEGKRCPLGFMEIIVSSIRILWLCRSVTTITNLNGTVSIVSDLGQCRFSDYLRVTIVLMPFTNMLHF